MDASNPEGSQVKSKVLVAIALVIPILVIFVVFINFLSTRKDTPTNENITQIPLSNKSYSYSKKAQLSSLAQKLPVTTKDFSMTYDKTSNSIVLDKKTSSADAEIDKWLSANGIKNIFNEQAISEATIANNILVWLNGIRVFNNKSENGKMICDGGYADEESCNPIQKTCKIGVPSNDSGLIGTWTYFQAYKKTQNPEYLAIVQSDLEIYSNYDKISMIQVSQYAIRWLFEMWESPLLTDNDKANIALIIYRIQYDPHITTPLISEYAEAPIASLKLFTSIDEIKKSAYLISEYTYAYKYFLVASNLGNANEYKNQAIYLFKKAKESYNKMYKTSDETPYLLSIAAYDLSQIDINEEYSAYANSLLSSSCESAQTCTLRLLGAQLWKSTDVYTKTLGIIKSTQTDLLDKKIIYNNQIKAQELMIYNLFNNALFAGIVNSHE